MKFICRGAASKYRDVDVEVLDPMGSGYATTLACLGHRVDPFPCGGGVAGRK